MQFPRPAQCLDAIVEAQLVLPLTPLLTPGVWILKRKTPFWIISSLRSYKTMKRNQKTLEKLQRKIFGGRGQEWGFGWPARGGSTEKEKPKRPGEVAEKHFVVKEDDNEGLGDQLGEATPGSSAEQEVVWARVVAVRRSTECEQGWSTCDIVPSKKYCVRRVVE